MDKNDPPFTFRAVQNFVAAVEAQSVTRAAHRLGTSPSSVSQQLTSLEAALGARLIERSARQFRLTRAGALFLDPAKALLDNIGAAKAKLVLADQAPPLNLRFASIEELDATVTAPWLLKLVDRFPKAALSLTGGASHENHDALSSRAVDMTLAVDTVAKVDWVERHPILRDPFILVTAKGADLTNSPMIRYELELAIGRQIEAQLRRTGPVPARGFAFSTNQALFAMTAELGGWAITTALAYLGTPLARDLVDAKPLHIPRFSRRLELHSRAGALGDLPRIIAGDLRTCIADRIIPDAAARLRFLGDDMKIIQES
ncbi:MAG: LysR family transcriptional regulator [Yoonia sp.]|jgi:DNA-binding transcriptional LysR family regulator|tara:strand:+ start:1878 stop:2825 length:948 start_codon:yes stop_codon:yes gene_type:complete